MCAPRHLLALLPLMLLLSGCFSTPLYTAQDLQQVRDSDHTLVPLYKDFRAAFHRRDAAVMQQDFEREQIAARQVDQIDVRDSIDPNTNLFQASAELDNLCNDIEAVWAAWEKAHHMPYDKSIQPALLSEAFQGSDKGLKDLAKWLRHPSSLS